MVQGVETAGQSPPQGNLLEGSYGNVLIAAR